MVPWPPIRSDVEPDSWNRGPDPVDSGFSVAAPQTLGRDLEELRVTSFQWAWPPGSLPCFPLCSGPLNVEIWMHTEIKAICSVARVFLGLGFLWGG